MRQRNFRYGSVPRVAALLVFALLLAGCSQVPTRVAKVASVKLAGQACPDWTLPESQEVPPGEGHSGHIVLDTGRQAFVSRIALLQSAQRTFDAQYYIWNNDQTGRILAEQAVAAARRGVRVRLLIDDYGTANKDNQLAALDVQANVEVRVYNPFNAGYRSGLRKWASFALGFSRLNRRMHSKTFIVDNCAVITGGRNIGDEYFDADHELNHRDRGLLSTGPVVDSISDQFDEMWNSDFAIPISALVKPVMSEEDAVAFFGRLDTSASADAAELYPLPERGAASATYLQQAFGEAVWAPTSFYYNPPAITRGDTVVGAEVGAKLLELLDDAQREVMVESAYFTVLDEMLDTLAPYLEAGPEIRVITNSLATTDVWTIHAGYTRNREELLRQGLQLFEWRPDAASCPNTIDNPHLNCRDFRYSLHAKTAVFDRETALVGSFNLNPRSRLLNTETALVIQSPDLAGRIADDIATAMTPQNSWRLGFAEDAAGDAELRWYGAGEEGEIVLDHEPDTGWWQRVKVWLAARLPLEKYW